MSGSKISVDYTFTTTIMSWYITDITSPRRNYKENVPFNGFPFLDVTHAIQAFLCPVV